jgi:hypothetical protein
MPRDVAAELDDAARVVPTEASLQAVRCALGETGDVPIREGRRHVRLGPVGALTFFFELRDAVERVLPLARAVLRASDLDAAHEALADLGVSSELAYERARAAEKPAG